MGKKEKYISVGTYKNPLMATIDCDMLRREGIHARVEEMDTILNTSFYSDDIGLARLLVPEDEVEKALEIIANSIVSRFN